MPQRFLMQPNGKLACFSEIVDNFVQANLTPEDAIRVSMENMGREEAVAKVGRGLARGLDAKGGWNECLATIRAVRGEAECAAVVAEILGDAEPAKEVRPRDVHGRLQDLVDDHFGVRPTTPIEGLLTILETELLDEDTLLQCIADAAGCSEDDGFEDIVERVKALREWRDAVPKCHYGGGCPKIGTKWVARHVLYCDEHGSQFLQDAPWAGLARKEQR